MKKTNLKIQHRILFVCIHNSARSQMAEAFLNQYGEGLFTAELEKGKLNPYVVKVMQEAGIDISGNQTKEVFDFFTQGKLFQAVITVCDAVSESCPVFPGMVKRLGWSFADPSKFTGTERNTGPNQGGTRRDQTSSIGFYRRSQTSGLLDQ